MKVTDQETVMIDVRKVGKLLGRKAVEHGYKAHALKGLAAQLEGFAEADANATLNSVAAGRVYHQILSYELEEQQVIVTALAAEMGAPAPEYGESGGRPSQGRSQLAAVVYHAHPRMLRKHGKNKDTLAGKSVSRCLRAYKESTGERPERQRGARGTHVVSRPVFEKLYTACSGRAEQAVLLDILGRVGMSPQELDGWIAKLPQVEAPQVVEVPPAAEGNTPAHKPATPFRARRAAHAAAA